MAKKEISIIIRARNAMAAGLASVGNSLKSFGQSALNIGKVFATAFIAAGSALVALGVKAVSAFAESEKAANAAEAALRAYGDEVPKNLANIKRFAAAIQDETGKSDDNMVQRAATLRMLGVEVDQLEAATKATIGLEKAGMGEEQAIKAVAGAMEGHFEALQKFLPALKGTKDEAEKARIVNEFLTRSYQTQKDALNTVGGQWGLLKERVGDVWEEVGAAIAQNGALQAMFAKASEAIKNLGDRISKWVASGGVEVLITTIKLFGENVRNVFTTAVTYAVGFFKGGILNPGRAAFQYLGSIIGSWAQALVAQFEYIGGVAAALWKKLKAPSSAFDPPSINGFLSSMGTLEDAFKGRFVDEMPDAFGKMYADLEKESTRHAAAEKGILEKQAQTQLAAAKKGADGAIAAMEQIAVARADFSEEIKKLQEKEKDLAKDLAEKEKDEAIDAQEKKIEALEKVRDKQEEISKKTIADIIAEQKAKDAAAKQDKKDAHRAEELLKRKQRGAKLSKKDEAFLAAQQQIAAAKQFMQQGQGGLGGQKALLGDMQKAGNKTLGQIKTELETVHKDLANLMKRK